MEKGKRDGEVIYTHFCGDEEKQVWKNGEIIEENNSICWMCTFLMCLYYPWYWLIECINLLAWLQNEWINIIWQVCLGVNIVCMMFPPLGVVIYGIMFVKWAEFCW